jgi:plastocyanin
MGLRRYAFLLVCALLGSAVAVLPAVAGSETAPTTIEAQDSTGIYNEQHHSWSPPQVTIGPGGVLTVSNPSSTVEHGVEWRTGPSTPSCSGVPLSTSTKRSATKWSGTCTFTQPGTYTFYCTVHGSEMTGTVMVSSDGTTTTTTTTGTTTTTTQPAGTNSTPSGAPGSSSPQPAGLAGPIVVLGRSQRGRVVHGSIEVPGADAGGRLEVDLLAKRAVVAPKSGASTVRVGRLVRPSIRAGRLSFTVALNAKARAVLARRRRLALIVKVVLTPPHGSSSSTSRNVVLHF